MPVYTKKMAQLGRLAREYDLARRDDYSGRGMFGKNAAFAAVGSMHPESEGGKALRRAGCRYDQMGLDWVYYTHA